MPFTFKYASGHWLPAAAIQSREELVIRTVVDFSEFNEYACPDIELARLILRIAAARDIAAAPL